MSVQLSNLKRQRSKLIAASDKDYHRWLVTRTSNANNMRSRNEAYKNWQKSINVTLEHNERIRKLEQRENAGVTACSLMLAKATAQFEGGRSSDGLFKPYYDSQGRVWTIGYGHTNADRGLYVSESTHPLTTAEATALLLHDLNTVYGPALEHYLRMYGLKYNQKQFDASTDFDYNLGPGYFAANHDVGAAMKRHDFGGITRAMLEYYDPGTPDAAGLLRRRKWEVQLFNGGTYNV